MPARRRKSRPYSRAEIRQLFERFQQTKDPATRETLILAHRGLASFLASKFTDRGEPPEDLFQVAQVGLINAVDRYDPSRGIEFSTFATPTIVGEIRRHFRDKLWSVHVPRRLRELNRALMQSVDVLSQRLGRSPTINELAEESGVPFDVVLEALEAGRAYTPASLDAERGEEEDGRAAGALAQALGHEDPEIERVEDRTTIEWALGRLSVREREIVMLRFSEQLSQSEIARRLGVSQMHVSRLQRSAVERLRAMMRGDRPSPPAEDPGGEPRAGR